MLKRDLKSKPFCMGEGTVVDVFTAQGLRDEQQDAFGVYALKSDVLESQSDHTIIMKEIFTDMAAAVQHVLPTPNEDGAVKDFGTTATLVMVTQPGTITLGHIGDTAAFIFAKSEEGQYTAERAVKITKDHTLAVIKADLGFPVSPRDHNKLTAAISHRGGLTGGGPLIRTQRLTEQVEHGATLCLFSDGVKNTNKPEKNHIVTPEEHVQMMNSFTPELAGPVAEVLGMFALACNSGDNVTAVSTRLPGLGTPFMVAVFDGFGPGNGGNASQAAAHAVTQHPVIEARIG